MKNLNIYTFIKMYCLIGTQILSLNTFAAIDRTEVNIELSDSNKANNAFILIKDGSRRALFMCDKVNQVISRDSCREEVSYMVKNIKDIEKRHEVGAHEPLSYRKLGRYKRKLGRGVFTVAGTVGGFVVGAFGTIVLTGGGSVVAPGPGTVAGNIAGVAFLGTATYGGNRLGHKVGSFITGSKFTDEESNAILTTIGHLDIVNEQVPASNIIKINITTEEFINQLELARSLIL